MNRQDGHEVAAAFTGEQNFVSSVLASSTEHSAFKPLVSWMGRHHPKVLSLDKIFFW